MTRTLIVVPMKDLFASKTRLAGTLSNSARNKLVHLLYEKTLNFLIPIAVMEKVEIARIGSKKLCNTVGLTGYVEHRAATDFKQSMAYFIT